MDIKQQRRALGLSQSELAIRLGLSRPTLQKIETGERPLKKTEKVALQKIFAELSEVTADMRVHIPAQNLLKFQQVLLYVLQAVGAKPNVGLTVLYKLLYFIDFDYYEKYEQQLMGLTYIKNTHGPTPREFAVTVEQMRLAGLIEPVRSSYFAHEQKKFLPKVPADLTLINGQELDMIDDVLDRYGDKSARQLSDLSHEDTPWKATQDKQNIEYELAFYRTDRFSVRDYGEL